MDKPVAWKNVLKFAGAIVAYLIGAGVASGQEALQFFAAFGVKGAIGAAILACTLYIWFSATIMRDGHSEHLAVSSRIFAHYCGRHLGRFLEFYAVLYLVMVFMVMLAGAGAILNECYGLHPQIGRVLMAILALVTVLMGLKNLVNIVARLGPVIILSAIAIAIGNIIANPAGIGEADAVLATITVNRAAPAWYISGFIFPATGCVLVAPFLARLGGMANSRREATLGGLLGGGAFIIAVIIMCFGVLASIGDLYQQNIPTLFIIRNWNTTLGIVFSVVIFAAVYTTSVPMLWLSCNAIAVDENSRRFTVWVFIITIVAFIGGQFEFARLVNVLYPLSGYIGLFLFASMLYQQVRWLCTHAA
jgi:uncharacterized membrane protein YkvI